MPHPMDGKRLTNTLLPEAMIHLHKMSKQRLRQPIIMMMQPARHLPFIQDDHTIEQISSADSDPALGDFGKLVKDEVARVYADAPRAGKISTAKTSSSKPRTRLDATAQRSLIKQESPHASVQTGAAAESLKTNELKRQIAATDRYRD